MVGKSLGHYKILDSLGAGGMGEVYRAEDTRLNRQVAIKMLPPGVASDPERIARFEREAKALAALDHPNIVHIFSVEESDGIHFLTMQLVEGTCLADRIPKQGANVDQLLAVAVPLADALRAAHERGITHRDLKPANVMLDSEDRVKVLDFGLAKVQVEIGPKQATGLPTEPMTRAGQILGTVPYMSPEQTEGKAIDHRSDLFSFGVMLYEMATGRRPFQGDSAASLISAILRDSPPAVTDLNRGLPPDIARIVSRCLEKDPERRFQSAKELHNELQDLQRQVTRPSGLARPAGAGLFSQPQAMTRGSGVRFGWLVGAAVLAAVIVIVRDGGGGASDDAVPEPATARVASIAVLPLENLSGDPDQEYFADGMTGALIAHLAQIRSLKVISRTSTLRYKNSDKTIREIAQELGVDAVLEGSVMRENDLVAVNVQLISAHTEQGMWARRYQREMSSVLALHGEVAQQIASEIRVQLSPEEALSLAAARKVNQATYEAYLRGMHELGKGTAEGYRAGIRQLQEAVDADPTDPLAYAGLALGYIRIGHGPGPSDVAFPRAAAASRRALELDPNLAEALASLADARMYYEWDWPGAKAAFERAVEIKPSLAEAHAHYTWWYVLAGNWAEAVAEAELAVEYDPLSATWTVWLGWLHWWMGNEREALVQIERAFELDPDHPSAWYVLGAIHGWAGRFDEAIAAHERASELDSSSTWALAVSLTQAGRDEEARRVLASISDQDSPEALYDRAIVHGFLGDTDEAFKLLDQAYEHRSRRMPWVSVDPNMEPLRDDPRMSELFARLSLPDRRTS